MIRVELVTQVGIIFLIVNLFFVYKFIRCDVEYFTYRLWILEACLWCIIERFVRHLGLLWTPW